MYIGDWSSDVCSSDLEQRQRFEETQLEIEQQQESEKALQDRQQNLVALELIELQRPRGAGADDEKRSEERRVGKECRARGTRCQATKEKQDSEEAASA